MVIPMLFRYLSNICKTLSFSSLPGSYWSDSAQLQDWAVWVSCQKIRLFFQSSSFCNHCKEIQRAAPRKGSPLICDITSETQLNNHFQEKKRKTSWLNFSMFYIDLEGIGCNHNFSIPLGSLWILIMILKFLYIGTLIAGWHRDLSYISL